MLRHRCGWRFAGRGRGSRGLDEGMGWNGTDELKQRRREGTGWPCLACLFVRRVRRRRQCGADRPGHRKYTNRPVGAGWAGGPRLSCLPLLFFSSTTRCFSLISCCFVRVFLYAHRLFYLVMTSKQTKKKCVCVCRRPEENIPRFCRWGRHDLLACCCLQHIASVAVRTCVCTTRRSRI